MKIILGDYRTGTEICFYIQAFRFLAYPWPVNRAMWQDPRSGGRTTPWEVWGKNWSAHLWVKKRYNISSTTLYGLNSSPWNGVVERVEECAYNLYYGKLIIKNVLFVEFATLRDGARGPVTCRDIAESTAYGVSRGLQINLKKIQ